MCAQYTRAYRATNQARGGGGGGIAGGEANAKQLVPTARNPLGVKGVGEAGTVGSIPAVMNAITDAIGTNALEMPATPQAVWAALQAARPAQAAE